MTLQEYFKSIEKVPYDRYNHNCYQFTNKCWEIIYGKPWSPFPEAVDFRDTTKYRTFLEGIDDVLQRVMKPSIFNLVALKIPGSEYSQGLLFGICMGQKSIFLNTVGTKYLNTRIIKYCWKNK